MSSWTSSPSSKLPNNRVSRHFLIIVVVAFAVYFQLVRLLQAPGVEPQLVLQLSTAPSLDASVDSELQNANGGPIAIPVTTVAIDRENASSTPTNSPVLSFCFVASTYGQWASNADRLQNVRDTLPSEFYNASHVHFFVFTNLPRLEAPGWTKVIRRHEHYKRFITQSRFIKFWGWNETYIQTHCQVVFYMDSIGKIIGSLQEFQEVAISIWESPQGHAQYLHRGGGGALGEFRRIEVFHKDTPENIQVSKEWLLAQPDFQPPSRHNCTLYENRYIGYAVGRPTTFATAAAGCFWPRYSLELDSWRDQPLWCYCLDHYNITPLPLDYKKLWKLQPSRMGKAGHKYKTEKDVSLKAAKKM